MEGHVSSLCIRTVEADSGEEEEEDRDSRDCDTNCSLAWQSNGGVANEGETTEATDPLTCAQVET